MSEMLIATDHNTVVHLWSTLVVGRTSPASLGDPRVLGYEERQATRRIAETLAEGRKVEFQTTAHDAEGRSSCVVVEFNYDGKDLYMWVSTVGKIMKVVMVFDNGGYLIPYVETEDGRRAAVVKFDRMERFTNPHLTGWSVIGNRAEWPSIRGFEHSDVWV